MAKVSGFRWEHCSSLCEPGIFRNVTLAVVLSIRPRFLKRLHLLCRAQDTLVKYWHACCGFSNRSASSCMYRRAGNNRCECIWWANRFNVANWKPTGFDSDSSYHERKLTDVLNEMFCLLSYLHNCAFTANPKDIIAKNFVSTFDNAECRPQFINGLSPKWHNNSESNRIQSKFCQIESYLLSAESPSCSVRGNANVCQQDAHHSSLFICSSNSTISMMIGSCLLYDLL